MLPKSEKHSMVAVLVVLCTLGRAAGVGHRTGLRAGTRAPKVRGRLHRSQVRRSDGMSWASAGMFEPASTGFARLVRRRDDSRRLSVLQYNSLEDENGAAQNASVATPLATKNLVWIAGWPRSGSTTMFEMVLAGAQQDQGIQQNYSMPEGSSFLNFPANFTPAANSSTATKAHFGLFEPCHWGLGNTTPPDRYAPDLDGDCGKVMDRLLNCNYSGVEWLFGWSTYSGPHTDISGIDSKAHTYKPDVANDACSSSELVVYKTVQDYGRSIDNLIPILDAHPLLRILVPERDPRGIAASWGRRPWGASGVELLLSICKMYKANLYQKHPRLRRVSFERLASDPVWVMSKVFGFLDLEFGSPQMNWINQTFNSSCDGQRTGDFATCHTDSQEPLMRWRTELSQEELQAFNNDPDCREVAQKNGYPLDPEPSAT